MVSLLAIGFGMLVIGLRLMTLRNSLRRAGNVRVAIANQVLREGLVICFVGLIALLVGIFCSLLSNPEAIVLTGTGASLMYVGLLSLVQGVVQMGQGTDREVGLGAWVVTWIGVGLIVAYVIYRIVV